MTVRCKFKKGDKVIVIAGADKGKTGEILKVMPRDDRVIVQGVCIRKRHTKPSAQSQGGIIAKEASIHLSNILHVDSDGKPSRIGRRIETDGNKVVVAKTTGEIIAR